VVIMNAYVTTGERNRIDSYLAIKYGITFATGINYVDSTGSVIRNATANSGYVNNITVI